MNDLTKDLYEFVCAKRMGDVYQDPEYEEMSQSVEFQVAKVQDGMNEAQLQELRRLLENLSAIHNIEREHFFQAALKLAKELNGLVRA